MTLPLIVFCHLRWDFVYQRPQQLISRLAKDRPVFFIEEPVKTDGPARWQLSEPEPGVTVCRPHTPIDAPPQFNDEQALQLQVLTRQLIDDRKLDDYALWFYTPMALPVADGLTPRAIVYDCMDELSAFLYAPPQLLQREAELLERADVVFTGGPSLYRSKKDRHPNVHCFPSSVDHQHYGQALTEMEQPADQRDLPRPRFGFFGVIDERMDLSLLEAMATAHPEWQIVMLGPVVKINPATLPRNPNIHYLGQKQYADLPRYLSGWDVALLPFARNPSTKFISPTKTLEYMAAEKPTVSTPITDVAEPYGHVVHLGDTPEQFVHACEQALADEPAERERRARLMREVLSKTSWDATAARMTRIIDEIAEGGAGDAADRKSGALLRAASGDAGLPTVVVGAGPTGLSAAYHLGDDALLLEKNDGVGGWCRSIVDKGFTFDMAGHIMFSNDPYVHELYQKLLGDNVHWQDREAWVYSKNVYTRYPFQGCLYGLPAEVISECIVGAIEARFGPIKQQATLVDNVAKAANAAGGQSTGATVQKPARANGNGRAVTRGRAASGNVATCRITGGVKDCCGDGILEAEVALRGAGPDDGAAASQPPRNFEEFIYKVWGRGIARHFAIPYNRKLWAVPLTEMETSWLGGRVPMPDIEEMIRYALTPPTKPMGPNARFGYPLRGGFQSLMNGFVPHIQRSLRLGTPVIAVSPSRHTLTTAAGEVEYDHLISTMPLPVLIRSMGDEAPAEVRDAMKRLRYVSVRCVNIGVGREHLTEKHWVYYPEDTVFHRIFVQGNASPHCNPPGGFGITCEITYAPGKPLPCDGDDLIQRCVDDCVKVGMFKQADPIWTANQVDMPFAYVVYDHGRAANVKLIRDWLLEQDIILAGRYSEWEYYNSDHAFIAGKKAAELVRDRQRRRSERVAV